MKFENSFQKLPSIFYEQVVPTPLTNPKLVAISESCARLIDLDLSREKLLSWLDGKIRIDGDQRISTRYGGHQFGSWAGQLGDGRAISLGEIIVKDQRFEIQTKGSGLTPFSRMGDGKAVIRSSLREFMCSEAMAGLGVPTTRALALITGEDSVEREQVENSAIVARVFPSNLRFGHFEYAFHFGHHDELHELAIYTKNTFFSQARDLAEMLEIIVISTAKLVAKWQSVGFCHGVMNTDNMSILGITIDYGPFGFMEDFNKQWICNHSDPQGRYSYQNQPAAALWNLDRFLICFTKLLEKPVLQRIFNLFDITYAEQWRSEFCEKLGIESHSEKDTDMISELLHLMQKNSMDFTYTFRTLPDCWSQIPADWIDEELRIWREKYLTRLLATGPLTDERKAKCLRKNPKYVFRNYIAQEIIEDVEAGYEEKIHAWMNIFENPFDEHPEFHQYSLATPKSKKNITVSCSS